MQYQLGTRLVYISQIQNLEEKEGGSVLHGSDLLRVALVCVQTDP